MVGYLSVDIICSKKQTVFPERSSRKTVSFEELNVQGQISEHIFAPDGGYRVYYPSNLFRNAKVLKTGKQLFAIHFPSLATSNVCLLAIPEFFAHNMGMRLLANHLFCPHPLLHNSVTTKQAKEKKHSSKQHNKQAIRQGKLWKVCKKFLFTDPVLKLQVDIFL